MREGFKRRGVGLDEELLPQWWPGGGASAGRALYVGLMDYDLMVQALESHGRTVSREA